MFVFPTLNYFWGPRAFPPPHAGGLLFVNHQSKWRDIFLQSICSRGLFREKTKCSRPVSTVRGHWGYSDNRKWPPTVTHQIRTSCGCCSGLHSSIYSWFVVHSYVLLLCRAVTSFDCALEVHLQVVSSFHRQSILAWRALNLRFRSWESRHSTQNELLDQTAFFQILVRTIRAPHARIFLFWRSKILNPRSTILNPIYMESRYFGARI